MVEEWRKGGGGGVGGWTKTARDSRLAGHQTPLRPDCRPRLRLRSDDANNGNRSRHSYTSILIEYVNTE